MSTQEATAVAPNKGGVVDKVVIKGGQITLPPISPEFQPVPSHDGPQRAVYFKEGVVMSDYAVLQFLGKKFGFNPEFLKASLLTPELMRAIRDDAKSANSLGVRWRIVNGRVVGVESKTTTAGKAGLKSRRNKAC
jgi:hypothetical protein